MSDPDVYCPTCNKQSAFCECPLDPVDIEQYLNDHPLPSFEPWRDFPDNPVPIDPQLAQNAANTPPKPFVAESTIGDDGSDLDFAAYLQNFDKPSPLTPTTDHPWLIPSSVSTDTMACDSSQNVFDSSQNVFDSTQDLFNSTQNLSDSSQNLFDSSQNLFDSSQNLFDSGSAANGLESTDYPSPPSKKARPRRSHTAAYARVASRKQRGIDKAWVELLYQAMDPNIARSMQIIMGSNRRRQVEHLVQAIVRHKPEAALKAREVLRKMSA